MSYRATTAVVLTGLICALGPVYAHAIENTQIDMPGHLRLSIEAAGHREKRLISELDFMRMSSESGTIILDARSRQKYDELHVKGAVNLSFPDIAVESLKQTIPDKDTRILIYCNNNFLDASGPFPTKAPAASLNLSTYTTLYIYGYRNVFQLGPVISIDRSALPFESARTIDRGIRIAVAPVEMARSMRLNPLVPAVICIPLEVLKLAGAP